MHVFRNRAMRAVPVIAATALLAAACGGGGDEGGGGGGDPESGTVTILHAFTGEGDVAGLQAIIDTFQEQHPNITVNQEGSNSFEQLARTRVGGGDPPDIILHPQPGLLENFFNSGAAFPLDFLDRAQLQEQMLPGLLDTVTFEDQLYGIPLKVTLKDLVYYHKPTWDQGGYTIPETQEQLLQLTQEVAQSGTVPPWCIGIESGDATGWVATDWVESLVLRGAGPETYDQWVSHEVPFDAPEVVQPVEQFMAPIWTTDEYILGGTAQIVREAFGTSIVSMAQGDCLMHKQQNAVQSFITDQLPDAEVGTQYDVFYYPPIDQGDRPALIGGDIAALYTNNAAARTFMEFLATPEAGVPWAQQGAYLSPFAPVFDNTQYTNALDQRSSEILADATAVRFDGSDSMPADVGASSQDGSFWIEMTRFASGEQDISTAFSNINELFDQVAEQQQ